MSKNDPQSEHLHVGSEAGILPNGFIEKDCHIGLPKFHATQ